MTAQTGISIESAIAMLDEETDRIDSGGPGKLVFYSGIRPPDVSTSAGGIALLELDLPDPAFGGAFENADGNAEATANGTPFTANASATGTATWARVYNGAGQAVRDGNVGPGADFDLPVVDLIEGQQYTFETWVTRLGVLAGVGASEPGGVDGQVQFNDAGTLGGFGQYDEAESSLALGPLQVKRGSVWGTDTGLLALMLGDPGSGEQGNTIMAARDLPGSEPFLVLAPYSPAGQRVIYIGGGSWGTMDATRVEIWAGEDAGEGVPNTGVPRATFQTPTSFLQGPLNFTKSDVAQGNEAGVTALGNIFANGLASGSIPPHGTSEPPGTLVFNTSGDQLLLETSTSWEIVVTQEKLIAWNVTAGTKPAPGAVGAGHIVFDFDDRKLDVANGLGDWERIQSAPAGLGLIRVIENAGQPGVGLPQIQLGDDWHWLAAGVSLSDPLPGPGEHTFPPGFMAWHTNSDRPIWWQGASGKWITFQHVDVSP